MSINDNLKNAFYASLGFALKGKEKIEEAAKDFAEKNKLNAEDGAKFIKDVSSNFEEKRSDAEEFIKGAVGKAVNELGLVNRKEYDDLKSKYEELKSKVDNGKNN